MACTHPAICGGVCLVCHCKVENGAVEPKDAEVVKGEPKPQEKAQETPKKTTRKKTK